MIKFKPFVALVVLLNLISCNGQKSKNDLNKTLEPTIEIDEGKETKNNLEPSLFYSKTDNQISEVVRTMFQDSKGNIWFGTQNGAFKLVGDSLIHIDRIISKSGKGVTIKAITESKDGKIWIGHTAGISSIDDEKVTTYYESDGLLSSDVWTIAADKNGKIWIGTINGVCVFDGKEFKKFVLPEGKVDTTLHISSTKMVHRIYEDNNGTLWFSSNAGLFSYANNSLLNVSEKAGINTNFVNEIFEDSNGELWVSTKIGLYHLTDKSRENITQGKLEIGKGIGSVAEDKDGNLWFVSNQHFLYTYDGNELKEFHKSEANQGPVVFQIFKDRADRLWFVGFGGAFRLENGKFINVTKNGPW